MHPQLSFGPPDCDPCAGSGDLDYSSQHIGCDVKEGTKWAAKCACAVHPSAAVRRHTRTPHRTCLVYRRKRVAMNSPSTADGHAVVVARVVFRFSRGAASGCGAKTRQ